MADSVSSSALVDLTSGHTVRRFDVELAKLRGIILDMGEHVISQIDSAAQAMFGQVENQAFLVLDREPQIDYLALDADEEVFHVIARRQPAAVDLRIVLALSKIAGECEGAGDKVARVARQTLEIRTLQADGLICFPARLKEALRVLNDQSRRMFEQTLRAVSAFEVAHALGVFEEEPALYRASNEVRAMLGEDGAGDCSAREIVCLLTCAHAMERVGNHAANIAEQVIYVAEGQDVRFRNREILIETLRHRRS